MSIGACDKCEWTYFNGEPVGSLTMQDNPSAWSMQRVYTVPGRLVKAGKAAIAVRVYSNIYNGGLPASPFRTDDWSRESAPARGAVPSS